MNLISLDDILLVNLIARTGSFAGAADQLNTARPNVTRRIKQLEGFLGVTLFKRSTRQLRLTPEGEAFLQHSQTIEAQWKLAVDRMQSAHDTPSGTLRILAVGLFSRVVTGPFLSEFIHRYPDIELDLQSSWELPDAEKFDVDLMFNIEPLEDKSFVNEPIATSLREFYASPAYLARNGVPAHPRDLPQFDLITLKHKHLVGWSWREGEVEHLVDWKSRLCFDEPEAALQMALLDHGIAFLPEFITRAYVARGELVKLFGGEYATHRTLYAIYPRTPFEATRIRVFIDALRDSGLFGKPVD